MKTITTVREYDEEGRVTKETRTEVEYPDPVVVTPAEWWRRGQQGWWQNPVISSTGARVWPDPNGCVNESAENGHA